MTASRFFPQWSRIVGCCLDFHTVPDFLPMRARLRRISGRAPMHARLLLVAFALTCTALACAQPAAAQDMPARKPGLWEIKTTSEGHGMPPTTSEHCIDAETDKLMNSMGGNMRQEMCPKRDVQKVGSTIVVDSVCKAMGMTITSHSVTSGDFNSAYTVKITSKTEGGPPGLAGNTSITLDAKWMGACKADQKPGDMMSAGRKINIRDMQNMPGMPGAPAQKK